jgi:DNA replication protein DnaC
MINDQIPTQLKSMINEEGKANCFDCGEFKVDTYFCKWEGKLHRLMPYCEECSAKRQEAERQEEEERKLKKAEWRIKNIEHLLGWAGVPKLYRKCSLENFEGKLPNIKPAFITGRGTGIGKTHLGVGFLRVEIINNDEKAGLFLRAVDLFREIRNTFSQSAVMDEEGILKIYGSIPFLILDDLGAEKVTEFVQQTLYDLIDRRYSGCLDTLITSNLSLDELAQHYGSHGDRLASRIAGMGPTLKLKEGKDRRWQR